MKKTKFNQWPRPEQDDFFNIDDIETAIEGADERLHALSKTVAQQAMISCTAEYDAARLRHVLTPVQEKISLPEVFTIRFVATADFKAGDKVYLEGAEYAPAYTDSADAVTAGAWTLGTVVNLACNVLDKKAFVGAGHRKAFENKANKSESILNQVKEATNNDLLHSAIYGELGLLKINPAGAGEAATKNAPPGVGWGSCFAVQHGGTRMLIAVDDRGKLWTNGWNAIDWAGWTPIATAEPPQRYGLPLSNGLYSQSESVFYKNQFGQVFLDFGIHKSEGKFGDNLIITVLPEGFRPQHVKAIGVTVYAPEQGYFAGIVILYQNGSIVLDNSGRNGTIVRGNFSFLTV